MGLWCLCSDGLWDFGEGHFIRSFADINSIAIAALGVPDAGQRRNAVSVVKCDANVCDGHDVCQHRDCVYVAPTLVVATTNRALHYPVLRSYPRPSGISSLCHEPQLWPPECVPPLALNLAWTGIPVGLGPQMEVPRAPTNSTLKV